MRERELSVNVTLRTQEMAYIMWPVEVGSGVAGSFA